MCSVRPRAFFGYIRSRSSTVTDGRTVRCCLFQSKQNIGRGSYTLTRVHSWRMLPVTRFPGDISQGHAPQPHEKTAAATGVLHDRPQSTVCCRCQTEAPWPPKCPGITTSRGSYQQPRHKPASRRAGHSLPLGRGVIREQPPSRQLRRSATDARYRSGWKPMQPAVDCGLWIAGRGSQIVDCHRQSENHQSHLHALEACRTSAGETDGTIFLPSNSPAPSLRQLQAGRCSQ